MDVLSQGQTRNDLGARLRRRAPWLVACVVAGAVTIYVGQQWLAPVAACPAFYSSLLLVVTLPTAGGMGVWTLIAKNNSPAAQFMRVVAVLAVGLVIPPTVGIFASQMAGVQAQFCPCGDAERIAPVRATGDLTAAEGLARFCIDQTDSPQCKARCQCELTKVLYDKSDGLIKERSCTDASSVLGEAQSLVGQCNDPSFGLAIDARQQTYQAVCSAPPPTAPPVETVDLEILRTSKTQSQAAIDVRLLQDGNQLRGLPPNGFTLSTGTAPVPIKVTERKADDPVCVIAVVDNSGSISPGLTSVRAALDKLNEASKPDDQLGMVIFGDQATVIQQPGEAKLNTFAVNANANLTALWDGVETGLIQAQTCRSNLRYLIVLTDGVNNVFIGRSGDNPTIARQIGEEATSQNVSVCTVGIQSTETLDESSLKLVGINCGYYPAANADEVATRFKEIFGFVRDFYRITFAPDALSINPSPTLQYDGSGKKGEVGIVFDH